MLELLSKLKEACHREGLDLIHSEINGNAIKLACCVNGRRDTELNAYIIPDGDGFNFFTMTPNGVKSELKRLTETTLIPTLVSTVNKTEMPVVEEVEEPQDLIDVVTIEVADGVTDTKEARHGTYKNSRYAYSDKYHKMGTIIDIQIKK